MKLKKKRFYTELRHHFFIDRIINMWNSLDEKIVRISNADEQMQALSASISVSRY